MDINAAHSMQSRREAIRQINARVKLNRNLFRLYFQPSVCAQDFETINSYGYSQTFRCKQKSDGKLCVVKKIHKHKFHRISPQHRHRYIRAMCDEFDVMKTLKHAYIPQIYAVYEDKHAYNIVMEECKGNDLFTQICGYGTLTEKRAASIVRQILSALRYMHDDNSIIHGNLHPENILFLTNDPDSSIKITGFAMSKVLPKLKSFRYLDDSECFMAPETFKHKKYTHASDMWSVGVILFILVHGYPPFYVNPQHYGRYAKHKLYSQMVKGFDFEAQNGYHLEVNDLITKLLCRKERKRYTAKQALAHPWITDRARNDANVDKRSMERLIGFNKVRQYRSEVIALFRQKSNGMSPQQFYSLEQLFRKCDRFDDGLISHLDLMGNGKMEAKQSSINDAYNSLYCGSLVNSAVSYWFRKGVNKPMVSVVDMVNIIQIYYYESPSLNTDHISVCERPIGIKYEELLHGLVYEYLTALDDRLYDAFRTLDDDNDGKITTKELKSTLKRLDVMGEYDNAIKLIQEPSFDYNGVIDYEEFLLHLHSEDISQWMPDCIKKMCCVKLKPYRDSEKKGKHKKRRKSKRHKSKRCRH